MRCNFFNFFYQVLATSTWRSTIFLLISVLLNVGLVLSLTIDVHGSHVAIVDIIIIFKIEAISNRPCTEFIEQNFAVTISITILPLSLRVAHINAPFLQLGCCLTEFFVTKSSRTVIVNEVECDPVFIVLSEVLQQVTEFTLLNVIRSILFGGLDNILGCVESSDKNWLSLKQLRQSDNVFHS